MIRMFKFLHAIRLPGQGPVSRLIRKEKAPAQVVVKANQLICRDRMVQLDPLERSILEAFLRCETISAEEIAGLLDRDPGVSHNEQSIAAVIHRLNGKLRFLLADSKNPIESLPARAGNGKLGYRMKKEAFANRA